MILNARAAHIVRAKITNLFQRKKHLRLFIHDHPTTAHTTTCDIEQILTYFTNRNKTIYSISKTIKKRSYSKSIFGLKKNIWILLESRCNFTIFVEIFRAHSFGATHFWIH